MRLVDRGVGLDAHQLGLVPGRLQLFTLAKVGGEGHDLAAIGLLQPFQDDACVETARKCEHDTAKGLGHWFVKSLR